MSEKHEKERKNIAGKVLKTQRKFVIMKKLNNKQFIHAYQAFVPEKYKKPLCKHKASGREK